MISLNFTSSQQSGYFIGCEALIRKLGKFNKFFRSCAEFTPGAESVLDVTTDVFIVLKVCCRC